MQITMSGLTPCPVKWRPVVLRPLLPCSRLHNIIRADRHRCGRAGVSMTCMQKYVCHPKARSRSVHKMCATLTEEQNNSQVNAHIESPTQMQDFLLWLTAQGNSACSCFPLSAACGPLLCSCCLLAAGVKDLQQERCKLGVYNAEKGERGILSLQVCMPG